MIRVAIVEDDVSAMEKLKQYLEKIENDSNGIISFAV